MYYTKELSAREQTLLNNDADFLDAYNTIKILSDDFATEDADAIELDSMIQNWLVKEIKKTTKPKAKPKNTTPKFKKGDKVTWVKDKKTIYTISSATMQPTGEYEYAMQDEDFRQSYAPEAELTKYVASKKTKLPSKKEDDYINWGIELISQMISVLGVTRSDAQGIMEANNDYVLKSYNANKTPLATAKGFMKKEPKKTPEQLVKELLEQLSQGQKGNVSPEQVEAIVSNILKNRKVCFDDLCKEVVDLIKTTTNIKVNIPKLNTKTFKNDIPNLLKIIDDVVLGNNVMLIGGAGTGKTFLAEKVASVIGLETEVINCNQFTSPIEINGGQTIEGYQEGKLIKAWSEGKLLILDELPKLDPNTAGILNEALAKTGLDENSERAYIVNTRGDRFKKKAGFAVIATGNVYPNTESTAYGANNKQDLSLLDRFGGSVYEIEKNPEFEKKVILPNHLFIWVICDAIRTLIEKNKWEAQVSIRLMETSLKVYLSEMMSIKEKTDMTDRKTFKDVIDSFIWTFTEVQQVEIKRAIKYSSLFEKHQYRTENIDKNPL
jgi:MoxR-like ATPase